MAFSLTGRSIVLGVALISTLAAAGWLAAQDDGPRVEVVQAVKPTPSDGAARSPEVTLVVHDLSAVERRVSAGSERKVPDLFAPKSWEPPAPAAKVVVPPPPTAPPLPYTFMGKMIENGVTTVFLDKQGQSFAVKPGSTLEGTYRVDEIQGQLMTFTYLPLSQKQVLTIGRVN